MPAFLPVLRRMGLLGRPDVDPFERFFGTGLPALFGDETLVPALDVSESEKTYTVTAELPGMDKKDIQITFTDGILSIKGEKKSEREEKGEDYCLMERQYGSFSRSVRIPGEVDGEHVDAGYKDGVLTVTVPKSEKELSRHIEVKTN